MPPARMPYDNLSDFLNELQDDGDLVRVSAEVDPILEITEITDRVSKSPHGGPALFFENVRGSPMPVVSNLLGSYKRMCRALNARSFEEVAGRIVELIEPQVPESWIEKLKMAPPARLPPRIVRSGACQQVVKLGRDVDFGELPLLQSWPLDPGRLINLGQVLTKNPATDERNLELYGVQVKNKNTCAIHWHPHQAGFQNCMEYKRLGKQMPVAVSLGGDPVFILMATAPLPPRTDQFLLGGFLRGAAIDLVKCRTIELEVPASAEIVIEGYIDTTEEWQTEGPFGERTGFYSRAGQFPLYHVTAITHRANPVCPAMVIGKPPMEDFWLGKGAERVFLPLLRTFIPELVDYNLPRAGVNHNLCFVSIRKTRPMQARKVMNAVWSIEQTLFSKIVVVVDEHVNVHDEEQVWFHVGANVHPGRDVCFSEGPTDFSDHAAPVCGVGHKMGIDATRKLPEEGHPRPWPEETVMSRAVTDAVTERWAQYGLGAVLPEAW
jgi:4-hydroxy-3-polyprenylbenzoate decarboxylase